MTFSQFEQFYAELVWFSSDSASNVPSQRSWFDSNVRATRFSSSQLPQGLENVITLLRLKIAKQNVWLILIDALKEEKMSTQICLEVPFPSWIWSPIRFRWFKIE